MNLMVFNDLHFFLRICEFPFQKIYYLTLKTLCDHISKPDLEVCQKYSAARLFSTLFSVFGNAAKQSLLCLTYYIIHGGDMIVLNLSDLYPTKQQKRENHIWVRIILKS